MKDNTEKKTKKLQLPLQAYLSYILLATLLFTGVSMSKFATSVSGQDSARVAVMAANTTYTLSTPLVLAPGESVEFRVDLTNVDKGRVCEVAQEYTMSVENITGNMGLKFTYLNESKEVIDQVSGMFYAGTVDEDTFYVRVSWDGPQQDSCSYAVDALRVNVVAQQLDTVNGGGS